MKKSKIFTLAGMAIALITGPIFLYCWFSFGDWFLGLFPAGILLVISHWLHSKAKSHFAFEQESEAVGFMALGMLAMSTRTSRPTNTCNPDADDFTKVEN